MLNDNIIVYPQKVVEGINEMVPRNNTRPFIGGKVAEYGDWNVTTLLKTWYKPKIFGEFISGYAVIINVEAASLFNNALEQFPITYRKRFRLDDILITWLLADSLNIQRIHTNMIGMCRQSKSDGSISWNRSLAIVHCVEIERDSIDRVIVEQNADDSTTM
uniref:Uncharacterized protein n=1 Tax=Plectus sambesii TaxID=2011161 RepID=A0A914VE11_9BILA